MARDDGTQSRPSINAPGIPDYSTAVGERLETSLPDGTRVTLNTDTVLDVAFSEGQRVVQLLKGQAYFEVFKDPSRPFVVRAGQRSITALGTAFDVQLMPDRFQVALVEGKVKVGREADVSVADVTLAPGQALVSAAGAADQVTDVNVARLMRWRDGFVEFDGERLGDAVAEMNRYVTEPIVVRDERVAALRVSGVFRADQIEDFLIVIAEVLPVKLERRAGGPAELVWSDPATR